MRRDFTVLEYKPSQSFPPRLLLAILVVYWGGEKLSGPLHPFVDAFDLSCVGSRFL